MRAPVVSREAPLLVLIGSGIAALSVYAAATLNPVLILLPLLTALTVYLALTRFALFTLVMLAARTGLELIPLRPPTEILRASVLVTALYCAVAVVWLFQNSRQGRSRPSFLAMTVAAVAAVGLISAALSEEPLQAATGASRWLFLAVFVLVMERLVTRDELGDRFAHHALVAIAASMALPLLIGAVQIFSALPSVVVGEVRVSGSLSHPNTFGIYLAMTTLGIVAIVPTLPRLAKVGGVALAVLATVELVATYSRTSYVAFVVGAAVLIIAGRRWLLLATAIAVLGAVSMVPGTYQRWADLDQDVTVRGTPGNTLAWRLDYWGVVLDASADRRVTGLGLGVVAQTTDQEREPHNDFVRALAELGVLGLLAYSTLLGALVWRAVAALKASRGAKRTTRRGVAEGFAAMTAAFLVASVTGNPMTQLVLLWYFFGYAAIARPHVITRDGEAGDDG